MVLTSRTRTTLFVKEAEASSTRATALIRLPLSVVPHYETRCEVTGAIIPVANKPLFRPNLWSSDEHERFLHGLELFPHGPWKEVAKVVGTKTTRQTMTHAQKYRQKIERRLHGKNKKITATQAKSQRQTVKKSPVAVAAANHSMVGHSFNAVKKSSVPVVATNHYVPHSTFNAQMHMQPHALHISVGNAMYPGSVWMPEPVRSYPTQVPATPLGSFLAFHTEEFDTVLANLEAFTQEQVHTAVHLHHGWIRPIA